MTNVALINALLLVVRSGTCGRIHAHETWWQSGMGSCILPRLPTHLVQELNVDTVYRPIKFMCGVSLYAIFPFMFNHNNIVIVLLCTCTYRQYGTLR